MNAQPLLATDELYIDIKEFKHKLRKIKYFEKRALLQSAEALFGKGADYIVYDILGAIFSLEGNENGVIRNYEMALKLAPTGYENQHNYASSLHNIGSYAKARKREKLTLDNFPDDRNIIFLLTKTTLMLGRLEEATYFLNKLEQPSEHPHYHVIVEGLPIFKEANLSDDEAEKISNCIFNFLREKKMYLADVDVSIVDNCLLYQIYVDLPIEKIFDVNWEAAGVLAESIEDMRSDVIMFEFNSVDILLEGREE